MTSTTVSSAAKVKMTLLHCVRCHEEYDPDNPSDTVSGSCVIEHDYDNFHGCRFGTSWYKGTLQCCGAYHKFHRYYSESKTDPEYCYEGTHTTNVKEVDYTSSTEIHVCDVEKCGKENHERSKKEYEAQKKQQAEKEAEKEAQKQKLEQQQHEEDEKKKKSKPTKKEDNDDDDDSGDDDDDDDNSDEKEMNSDSDFDSEDSDSCEYACESSLEPPEDMLFEYESDSD